VSDALIDESITRLCWQIARRYSGDPDDLAAAGHLGAVIAARRYNPARQVPFREWAKYWIRHAIQIESRRQRRRGFARVPPGERPSLTPGYDLLAPEPPEPGEDWGILLSRLTRLEAQAVRLRFWGSLSLREMCAPMGLGDKEQCRRHLASALGKLRKAVGRVSA
jgi:DNA-directed RNA polymerase sigma subunit (sigma70/sigma32)